MPDLIIQKYGGTSLGDLSRISNVAKHIAKCKSGHKNLVVVVSAMGKWTDQYLKTANLLHKTPPKRELDMLLSVGERISMSLLTIALNNLNIDSISLTGSQSGILTDENHGNARIKSISGERIMQALAQDKVVIIAGFQGVSPVTKEITTLGRGGSDLTATALAVTLGAKECQIYTDVDGVLSCNPKVVPTSRKISQLSWQEASELSWSGAGVLHHRSANIAEKYKVPVEVKSSANPTKTGTKIGEHSLVQKGKNLESPQVTAISYKEKQALILLSYSSSPSQQSLYQYCLNWLWKQQESPSIMTQFMGSHSNNITLVADEQLSHDLLSQIRTDKVEASIVKHTLNLASISVIGNGFRQEPDFIEKSSAILAAPPTYMELKDSNLFYLVEQTHLESDLRNLHLQLLQPNSND